MTGHPHSSGLFGWPPGQAASPRTGPVVLGATIDAGNGVSPGAREGPACVRRASRAFSSVPCLGADGGDIAVAAGEDLAVGLDRLGAAVGAILATGNCPVVLGGDHSISYVPVERCQRAQDIVVVWFDAHTDFSRWHGPEPHDHKQVLRRIAALENVRRVVQVGYRGYTVLDETQLHEDVHVLPWARRDRAAVADALLELLPPDLPCYLSVDIDVLDPRCAPGTSSPIPGGMSPETLAVLAETIVRARSLAGLDLVEVNPRLDPGGLTGHVAAWLLWRILSAWMLATGEAPQEVE